MPTATATSPSGHVLAQSQTWETVENNVYFPPSSLTDPSMFSTTSTHTHCPWKGDASYYTVTDKNGKAIKDAAWYYPAPFEKAEHIKDFVAFYKAKVDVKVE